MRGKIIVLGIILLLSLSSVSALTGPQTYNGKQYYVVTSTDPSEDTGDEVCAKAGLTCLGYSEPSSGVCKLFHPGAAEVASSSGDLSGTYCNGAPQTGVCAGESNSCHTCSACTATVGCWTPIGNLYREMYVECAPVAMACPPILYARNSQQLLNQLGILNSQLQACPIALPAGLTWLIKNGNVIVDIKMKAGGIQSFTITVVNGQVTGVSKGGNVCLQRVTISESDLDNILNSRDRQSAILSAFANKQAKISGCTLIRKVIGVIAQPIARVIVKRNIPPPPPPPPAPNCGKAGEQCNNRGCETGICAAPKENVNGQWRFVNYRCLTQAEWASRCEAHGNTPAPWDCFTGPCP